jgi:hypothetical protein
MLRDGVSEVGGAWVGKEGDGAAAVSRFEQLHRRLKRIVKARGALDAQEAAALREAQSTKMWRHFGCSSLVDYMEREMGYTARTALERLRVANAIEELPVIADAIDQGSLSFSGARELTRIVTPETQQAWLDAAEDKSSRQIEEMVRGHKPGDLPTDAPDPALRTKVLRFEVKLSTAALERQAKKKLEKERGERLDDDAFVRALFLRVLEGTDGRAVSGVHRGANAADNEGGADDNDGGANESDGGANDGGANDGGANDGRANDGCANDGGASDGGANDGRANDGRANENAERRDGNEGDATMPANRGCADGRSRYQIAVTICRECKRGWHDVGGECAELSPAAIECAQCDGRDIGSIDDDKIYRAKQKIPPAVRRKVFARDRHRCAVPGCRSTNLDVHHILELTNGGKHELSNLITLCEAHHLALHEGALVLQGAPPNVTFTRRPNNNFKVATRAVELAAALRKLGYRADEVRAAVSATRTHVGDYDLPIEQWLKIALSRYPSPASSRPQ